MAQFGLNMGLTLIRHVVSGEKPSCPGVQLNVSLLDCLSVTVTWVGGLGWTRKYHKNQHQLPSSKAGKSSGILLDLEAASFTFNIDVCFSGCGDALCVVSFTAEPSVFIHTCSWDFWVNRVALECSVKQKQPVFKVMTALTQPCCY